MKNRLVSPEVFALVKKLEAVVVATKYTLDGEVLVCRKDKTYFDLPLEVVPLGELPAGIKDAHKSVMKSLHYLIEEVRASGRAVPITRNELQNIGVRKKDLSFLKRAGLLKLAVIPLQVAEDGKPAKPAYCVYYTNRGRAFVRDVLGETNYGRGGDELWESVRQRAEELRRIWDSEPEGVPGGNRRPEGDCSPVQ